MISSKNLHAVSSEGSSIATSRDPLVGGAEIRPDMRSRKRKFQPPDAAMPGPLARLYPVDDQDSSAGGDSVFGGMDNQNQDRI